MKRLFSRTLYVALLLLGSLGSAQAINVSSFIQHCEYALLPRYDQFKTTDTASLLNSFWSHYPRFGFTIVDKRFILTTKTKELNLKLQNDLIAWKTSAGESIGESAPEIKLAQIAEGVSYDVTSLLPKGALELHGRLAKRNVNCWSTACYATGITNGLFGMNAFHFAFWMESPLAAKLSLNEEILPGDVVVYRKGKEESHAALYVSEDLTLSKNGKGDDLFLLQDAREVSYLYQRSEKPEDSTLPFKKQTFPKDKDITTSIYRVKPWGKFLEENKAQITPELKAALNELDQLERHSIFYNLEPQFGFDGLKYPEEYDAYQNARDDASQALQNRSLVLKDKAKLKLTAETSEIRRFIWSAILNRATDLK